MGNARLVEMLLARNVPFEEVWEQTGETALSMAVTYDDTKVPGLFWSFSASMLHRAVQHLCRQVRLKVEGGLTIDMHLLLAPLL
jgi:hypothetical protein